MPSNTRTAARKRCRSSREQIDVAALLSKPVTVGRDGREQRMTPFEVGLRAQVKKALTDKSLPAIKSLLDIALKYDLVMPAPAPLRNGGVLVVPGRLTKESWASLFKKPGDDDTPEDNNA